MEFLPGLEKYVIGGGIAVLFLVSVSIIQHSIAKERTKLRKSLVEALNELLSKYDQCRSLGDVMSVLDSAELMVAHIEHISPFRFDSRSYRSRIRTYRAQEISKRVQEKVLNAMGEARKTDLPGTKIKYISDAESLITRWMGHPALSAEQRHEFAQRLREIDEYMMAFPICAEYRTALRYDNAGRYSEAIQEYRQAYDMLQNLREARVDEEHLADEIDERIKRTEERLSAELQKQQQEAEENNAEAGPAIPPGTTA